MPTWIKKMILFFGTWVASTLGILLDELGKAEHLADISDVSLVIALAMGFLTAWAMLKSWLSEKPQED